MKKSDLIARISIHRGDVAHARDAHTALLLRFSEEYPIANFDKWDSELDDEWADSFYLRHRDDPECDQLWLIEGLSQVS